MEALVSPVSQPQTEMKKDVDGQPIDQSARGFLIVLGDNEDGGESLLFVQSVHEEQALLQAMCLLEKQADPPPPNRLSI